MGNENQLYSISLGVASLQGGLVGVATALSAATCRPFQVFSPSFFVGLELRASTTQGQETVLAEKAVEEFKTRLRGKLIRRGHKDYNEARTVFNAMIDRYPALIIRCAG